MYVQHPAGAIFFLKLLYIIRIDIMHNAKHPHLCTVRGMPGDINKNNAPWDRMNERKNELQYQHVSTYLRAWYKEKKNDSPIELGD
jgi:hypothetical protein